MSTAFQCGVSFFFAPMLVNQLTNHAGTAQKVATLKVNTRRHVGAVADAAHSAEGIDQ